MGCASFSEINLFFLVIILILSSNVTLNLVITQFELNYKFEKGVPPMSDIWRWGSSPFTLEYTGFHLRKK